MLEINAFLKDNFIVVNAEKKERKVINMTREKVIKVIESTFLDENIDKELYILYGTVLGGACGIIIKENKIEVYISCIAYASKRPEMVLTGKKIGKNYSARRFFKKRRLRFLRSLFLIK